jgi:hypothetical protein
MIRALDAWDELLQESLLLVVREPIGGLVEDSEMEKSFEKPPDWLRDDH